MKNILSGMGAVVLFYAIILMLFAACGGGHLSKSSVIANESYHIDSLVMAAQSDSVRWAEFLECSKFEGDAGCDSCWYVIFGFIPEEGE